MRLSVLLLGLSPLAAALSGIITDPAQINGQIFDYVVIGGGLGGMTVAGRLSEDASVSVLVIEAGSDSRNDPVVSDAYAYGQAFGRDDLLWRWPTVTGGGMLGGRTLGGSTAINGMTYTRGQAAQYDLLAELLGGDTAGGRWTWNGMLAGMKKAEGFTAPNAQQIDRGASADPSLHGTGGPVKVAFPSQMFGDQMKAFRDVCHGNFSIPTTRDPAGGSAAAVATVPNVRCGEAALTLQTINPQENDRRSSSAEAYFSPVEHSRSNFAVLINHRAAKIVTEGSGSGVRATGVQFGTRPDHPLLTAHARREVIVAAGAIMSPALLQLSGIGERARLEALGVPVVVDLRGVGKNLQEQTMSTIGWTKTANEGVRSLSNSVAFPDINALFAGGASAIGARIRANIKQWASEALAAGAVVSECAGEVLLGAQADQILTRGVGLLELFFDNGYPNGGYGINTWNLLPFSRGSVNIVTASPFEVPRVDPRYYAADVDVAVQARGARMTRQIFKAAPLRGLVSGENQPGTGVVPDDASGGTDAAWTSWVMSRFDSVNHPVGTCSMMLEEYGGVVDARLRVYHTTNLRVVDASVLPTQMSAHLSATLYGLAENAAEIIKSGQ